MDGHADIPPSYTGLSQYPTTPFGDGGDESFNRATMPPPRGSSLAPLPQCLQFPPTSQYRSQNFIPSATVANEDMPALSPIPYMMMPNSFSFSFSASSGLPPPPSKPRKRASGKNFTSRLNSLLANSNQLRTYPNPIGMPVGLRSQNEVVNVEHVSNGNKRRAGNEVAPPSRIWRNVSAGSSSLNDEPSPLRQGVSVDAGNGIAYGGVFTAYQLSKIAASEQLKEMAASDPTRLKRLLSNRDSAARSRKKKVQRQSELEIKVETLGTQIDTLTAELELVKGERMAADDECVQLKIRLDGREKHVRICDAFIEKFSGEVNRIREEASREREEASREREEMSRLREEVSRLREEVSEYRRRESERMNANMLEQLDINPQFHEKPQQTNYNFE